MKPTSRHSQVCAAISVPSDFDPDEFKDLYYASTEIQFSRVQQLLAGAGYVIRRAELLPHGQPMAYVRLMRKTAPLIENRSRFRQHIRQILLDAPSWFSRAELDAQQDGRSVLVSFLWEASAPVLTEAEQENEFLPIPI